MCAPVCARVSLLQHPHPSGPLVHPGPTATGRTLSSHPIRGPCLKPLNGSGLRAGWGLLQHEDLIAGYGWGCWSAPSGSCVPGPVACLRRTRFTIGNQVSCSVSLCVCHLFRQLLICTYCVWPRPHRWGALSSGPTLSTGQPDAQGPSPDTPCGLLQVPALSLCFPIWDFP